MTPDELTLDDVPVHVRALALRVRRCEDGEPWPETELTTALTTWPVADLLLLVDVLAGEILGWTCDLQIQIAGALRERDLRRLSGPGSLIEQFGHAHRRAGQVGEWRRRLWATPA